MRVLVKASRLELMKELACRMRYETCHDGQKLFLYAKKLLSKKWLTQGFLLLIVVVVFVCLFYLVHFFFLL